MSIPSTTTDSNVEESPTTSRFSTHNGGARKTLPPNYLIMDVDPWTTSFEPRAQIMRFIQNQARAEFAFLRDSFRHFHTSQRTNSAQQSSCFHNLNDPYSLSSNNNGNDDSGELSPGQTLEQFMHHSIMRMQGFSILFHYATLVSKAQCCTTSSHLRDQMLQYLHDTKILHMSSSMHERQLCQECFLLRLRLNYSNLRTAHSILHRLANHQSSREISDHFIHNLELEATNESIANRCTNPMITTLSLQRIEAMNVGRELSAGGDLHFPVYSVHMYITLLAACYFKDKGMLPTEVLSCLCPTNQYVHGEFSYNTTNNVVGEEPTSSDGNQSQESIFQVPINTLQQRQTYHLSCLVLQPSLGLFRAPTEAASQKRHKPVTAETEMTASATPATIKVRGQTYKYDYVMRLVRDHRIQKRTGNGYVRQVGGIVSLIDKSHIPRRLPPPPASSSQSKSSSSSSMSRPQPPHSIKSWLSNNNPLNVRHHPDHGLVLPGHIVRYECRFGLDAKFTINLREFIRTIYEQFHRTSVYTIASQDARVAWLQVMRNADPLQTDIFQALTSNSKNNCAIEEANLLLERNARTHRHAWGYDVTLMKFMFPLSTYATVAESSQHIREVHQIAKSCRHSNSFFPTTSTNAEEQSTISPSPILMPLLMTTPIITAPEPHMHGRAKKRSSSYDVFESPISESISLSTTTTTTQHHLPEDDLCSLSSFAPMPMLDEQIDSEEEEGEETFANVGKQRKKKKQKKAVVRVRDDDDDSEDMEDGEVQHSSTTTMIGTKIPELNDEESQPISYATLTPLSEIRNYANDQFNEWLILEMQAILKRFNVTVTTTIRFIAHSLSSKKYTPGSIKARIVRRRQKASNILIREAMAITSKILEQEFQQIEQSSQTLDSDETQQSLLEVDQESPPPISSVGQLTNEYRDRINFMMENEFARYARSSSCTKNKTYQHELHFLPTNTHDDDDDGGDGDDDEISQKLVGVVDEMEKFIYRGVITFCEKYMIELKDVSVDVIRGCALVVLCEDPSDNWLNQFRQKHQL